MDRLYWSVLVDVFLLVLYCYLYYRFYIFKQVCFLNRTLPFLCISMEGMDILKCINVDADNNLQLYRFVIMSIMCICAYIYIMYIFVQTETLKGDYKFFLSLLTLTLFQTCVNFVLLLSTKKDI